MKEGLIFIEQKYFIKFIELFYIVDYYFTIILLQLIIAFINLNKWKDFFYWIDAWTKTNIHMIFINAIILSTDNTLILVLYKIFNL